MSALFLKTNNLFKFINNGISKWNFLFLISVHGLSFIMMGGGPTAKFFKGVVCHVSKTKSKHRLIRAFLQQHLMYSSDFPSMIMSSFKRVVHNLHKLCSLSNRDYCALRLFFIQLKVLNSKFGLYILKSLQS